MSGAAASSTSDFDVMAERLIPFAPREVTRRKMRVLAEEYREKLFNLQDLLEGGRLSCPLHEVADDVIITGAGRNGAKKFLCKKYHDPEMTGRNKTEFAFNNNTSFEALKVYCDFLVDALTLLTTCEGTYEGIAKYLNISKHMVEFSVQMLLDHLKGDGKEEIYVNDDLVVIYSDFSGTGVSRSASVIMSRVGEEIAYQVCCAMNWMTAWNFVRGLKEVLKVGEGTKVVFVTDGGPAWIDPIHSFFPEAYHVRQFHSENCRGLVYTHLRHEGKDYTVRCRWDAVLNMGEPSDEALRMRRRRHLESSGSSPSGSEERTELSDDVFVYEGIVKHPRGTRRKKDKGATVSGAMDDKGADSEPEGSTGEKASEEESEESEAISDERSVDDGKEDITPRTDGATRIFRGKLDDALKVPAARLAFSVLVAVFGGHYITSNAVEALFNVKPALRSHRTVKNGDAFVHLLLHLRTKVKGWSREKIRSYFRNEVVTRERFKRILVKRKGLTYDEDDTEQIVMDAYRDEDPVVIHYKDGRGRRTRRMVEPLKIEIDGYSGMKRMRAYCHLRQDERTFLLDRIVDAIPADTELSIISPDSI